MSKFHNEKINEQGTARASIYGYGIGGTAMKKFNYFHDLSNRELENIIDAGQNVLRGATGGTRSEAQFELAEVNFKIQQQQRKVSELKRNGKYKRERVSKEIDAANKVLQERELNNESD